ncbi:MAG TPA: DUF6236 family protein [Actinospica sp.]|jgi:hypothetical protein|nr:DUF6236 family protein [Actinospica sp.]
MEEIGLYYPYFHIRRDSWLKEAALFLPQVARVRPPGYAMRDSLTAGVLRDDLNFLIDVDPLPQAQAVATEFAALLDRKEDELKALYQVHPRLRLAWMHISQLGVATLDQQGDAADLIARLSQLRLGVDRRSDSLARFAQEAEWIGMHPNLVALYSCALADRIAAANMLTPVTDNSQLFTVPRLRTATDLEDILLGQVNVQAGDPAGRSSTMYACAALRTVIPAGIEHVPAEKIVRVRRALQDEFDAFRSHLGSLNEEFAKLDTIQDPKILRTQVDSLLLQDITKPTQELERGLRHLKLEPARAVLGLKSLELPALAALTVETFTHSLAVAASGALAIQLFATTRASRQASAAQRKSSAGYLLGVGKELDPASAFTAGRAPTR